MHLSLSAMASLTFALQLSCLCSGDRSEWLQKFTDIFVFWLWMPFCFFFFYDSKCTFQLCQLVFLDLISLLFPSLSGLERSVWHL